MSFNKKFFTTGGIVASAPPAAAAFDPLQNFETVTYTGNGSTQKITGHIRKGAAFNGSSSEIDLGNSAVFSSTTTGELSISLWINTTDSDAGYILAKGDDSQIKYEHNLYLNTNGTLRAHIYNSSASLAATVTTTDTVNDGNWHHVVLVIDNGTSMSVYVDNGTPVTSTGWSGTVTYQSTVPFILGAFEGITASSSKLNGKLDQVRIFNTALNPAQVGQLALEDYTDPKKSTTDYFGNGSGVALYELDEDANDTGVPIDSGQSAVFNGSSSQIDLNYASLGMGVNDFSYSFWFKLNSTSGTQTFFQVLSEHVNYGLRINSSYNLQSSPTNSSGGTQYIGSNVTLDTDWHHVAYIKSSTTGVGHALYYDGTKVAEDTSFTGDVQTASDNKTTLGSATNDINWLNGSLDQVRFFNTALSASDVQALASETNVPTANLVAHYKLDGDATDETTNYDGTWGGTEAYSDPAGIYYNGTPTNVNFLGMAFQPDFIWVKNRDNSGENHLLSDVASGFGKVLFSNLTITQVGSDNTYFSQLSNGFSINTDNGNFNTNKYVAWCWKAGGAAVSDTTTGDIDADISANTSSGFSIVKWTGNGVSGSTIPHGLDSAPELIITKGLSNPTSWIIGIGGISGFGVNDYLTFTNALKNSSSTFYQAYNTDTFTVGVSAANEMNKNSSNDYVSYLFHSVDGYQKVGSYSGTGVANTAIGYTDSNGDGTGTGAFIPRWVMIKRTDAGSSNWFILDSIRDATSPYGAYLLPNEPDAENNLDAYSLYFNSNGFTVNSTEVQLNALNGTYIYLAIA